MKQALIKSRLLWGFLFVAFILSVATADEKTDKVDRVICSRGFDRTAGSSSGDNQRRQNHL